MNAHQIVEAVLFASDAPLSTDEIARADESLDEDRVEEALEHLRAEYDDAGRSFELVRVADGYQILTRPEFAPYLERFDNVPRPARLSGPALETLAIIAYRQPIGRLEMEYIRGVAVSGVIRTLQDRGLIDVVGRAEGLGRPLLYGTTQHFLEHFGFRSLEDLPRPEELPILLRERTPLGADDDEAEGGEEPDADSGAAEGEEPAPTRVGNEPDEGEPAQDESAVGDSPQDGPGVREADMSDPGADANAALEVDAADAARDEPEREEGQGESEQLRATPDPM